MKYKAPSLQCIAIHVITEDLTKWYINGEFDLIQNLPPDLKDRILHMLTSGAILTRKLNIEKVLRALIHSRTSKVDLTSLNFELSDGILSILNDCSVLKKACFGGFGAVSVTRKGLTNFLTNKSHLYFLKMQCPNVDDEVLKYMVANCPKLMALDIGHCREITDEGIIALSALENLTNLIISHTQVSKKGLSALVKGPSGKKLKELRMNDCRFVTEDALYIIAENCPDLEVLIFYNCSINKDDTSLAFQSGNFKNLKQVTWTVTW